MSTLLLSATLFRATRLFALIMINLLFSLLLLRRCGHLNVLGVELAISLRHFFLISRGHLQIIMHHDSLLELGRVIGLGGHPQMQLVFESQVTSSSLNLTCLRLLLVFYKVF